MPLELNGIHYVRIASQTDSRAAAAWAATAILAWTKAQRIAPEFASEADLSFRQVEIAELANRLCTNKVQAAPINRNYVAGIGNHNFLVEVYPNRRRLSLYREFRCISEYPTGRVDYGWEILEDEDGNVLTYNGLIEHWWKKVYPSYFSPAFINATLGDLPPEDDRGEGGGQVDEVTLWFQDMPHEILVREGGGNGRIVGSINTLGGPYNGSLRVDPRLMELLIDAGAREGDDFIINGQYINFPGAVDEEAAFEFLENYFNLMEV